MVLSKIIEGSVWTLKELGPLTEIIYPCKFSYLQMNILPFKMYLKANISWFEAWEIDADTKTSAGW